MFEQLFKSLSPVGMGMGGLIPMLMGMGQNKGQQSPQQAEAEGAGGLYGGGPPPGLFGGMMNAGRPDFSNILAMRDPAQMRQAATGLLNYLQPQQAQQPQQRPMPNPFNLY